MSSPAVREAAPAYSDAEKGTLEILSPAVAANTNFSKDEKKAVDIVNVFPVTEKKEAPPTSKPTPPKKKKVSKWILWVLWYNTYRKLFTITFSLNMIALGCAASGYWTYAANYPGALVVGNLNFSVLMRNEIFGRLLYLFVNHSFAKWSPLWWRLGCTSVLQHLGGIHSGCAMSGVAWLIWMVFKDYSHKRDMSDSLLAFGVVINIVLLITIIAGLPWVRNSHHNVFERNHRGFGWTSLVMTWVFTILSNTYNYETQTWNLDGVHVVRQQAFWYTMGMTLFIVTPWICTRNVKVDIELPSPKVAVLRFERGMQQGLLARVSRSAIKEYHAFGIISEGTHAKFHYLICGVQGDFTKSLVNDPPTKIWTRQLKFAGVSNTSTLYKRGIRICTGTGLGAALSTCIQSPYWYLIWIGSDQEKTFGPTISGLIHRHIEPERLTLWDTKARGARPDTMKILREVYQRWNAEVVFITSNYVGNSEIMQGCKESGIPCFGTLWDFVTIISLTFGDVWDKCRRLKSCELPADLSDEYRPNLPSPEPKMNFRITLQSL